MNRSNRQPLKEKTMTSAEKYLERLEAALEKAALLDKEQRHREAAEVLQAAISTGNIPWEPEDDEDDLAAAGNAVQACSRERERQLLRAAKLELYLLS
jgi:hypothetical protein